MTDAKIRVGTKGRIVTIPEGYRRVREGVAVDGDMFANVFSGKLYPVEHDDINLPVEAFECLVRKKN